MALALLLCHHKGIPYGTCIMAAMVLLYATYWYSSTEAHITHGPGQGWSCIGPSLWVLVSWLPYVCYHGIPLSWCQTLQPNGNCFLPLYSAQTMALSVIWHHHPRGNCQGMQQEVQVWEKCFWVMDWALKLSKTIYCYILYYDFHKNGSPILLLPQHMPNTDIHSMCAAMWQTCWRKITQQVCHTAHHTLGV
jgi:hypothetical protein